MKRMVALSVLVLAGVVASIVASCGGTGGGISEDLQGGTQFVTNQCTPDSTCLELSAPSPQVVGDESSFRARLVDANGNGISGIEICFGFEDGSGFTTEPSDGCALTDSGGRISGHMVPLQAGSFHMIAAAPSGFNLTVRLLLRFIAPTPVPTATGTPAPTATGTTTPLPTETPIPTPTQTPKPDGIPCSTNAECASLCCCTDTAPTNTCELVADCTTGCL